MNSWALGERVWKNWPAVPKPQSFPWGKTWERQQGWERCGGSGGGIHQLCVGEKMPVVVRGGDHLCSHENLGLGVETVVFPVQMGNCAVLG